MGGRKRWIWGLAGLGAGWLAFGTLRAILSLRRGEALVAAAERLPRRYVVGEGPEVRMLVLGDSTVRGVGADSPESTLPFLVARRLGGRVRVTNLAVSGATTGDVARKQSPEADDGPFDVALVCLSANDATHGTPPVEVEAALVTVLERLRGVRRVALSTTPDFRTTPALPALANLVVSRRATALAAAIRRVAARYPNVRIADLYREGSLDPGLFAADGFHPSGAGYAVWAGIFTRAIEAEE